MICKQNDKYFNDELKIFLSVIRRIKRSYSNEEELSQQWMQWMQTFYNISKENFLSMETHCIMNYRVTKKRGYDIKCDSKFQFLDC